MSWPTMADFQEAIQNPAICFDDPELRVGRPVLNALGLPKPITGAFASVYKVQCEASNYAVRCFLRYHPDQELRYAAISDYLSRFQLPCMVTFKMLKKGMLVRGQWYPILKMEWIEGLPLTAYIEQHLTDPERLSNLADHFQELMHMLNHAQIAHGDLQHGNILMVNHEIRLIDYDGMYVPQLWGMQSHELGHRNYQHPRRSENDFGPYIDRFSAWIIYISLRALATHPELWHALGAGDEHLLLQNADFLDIADSQMMAQLDSIADESLGDLLDQLHIALSVDLLQIPMLSGLAPHHNSILKSVKQTIINRFSSRENRRLPTVTELVPDTVTNEYSGPDWVLDHIIPVEVSESKINDLPAKKVERFAISGGILFAHVLWSSLILGMLAPQVVITLGSIDLVVLLCFLMIQYFLYSEVQEKYLLWMQLLLQQRKIIILHWKMRRINTQWAHNVKSTAAELKQLDKKIEKRVGRTLSQIPLTRTELPDLSLTMLVRLRFFGVWSAYNVNEKRIVSIPGTNKAMSDYLLTWRTVHEQDARNQVSGLLENQIESQRNAIVRSFRARSTEFNKQEFLHIRLFEQVEGCLNALHDRLFDYQHVTFLTFLKWIYRNSDD